jgi:beta-phosphoglucomutase
MPALPIKAFIFDLDGVLADTATLHAAAWRRLAEEQGWDFTREMAEKTRGLSREDSLRLIMGNRPIDAGSLSVLLQIKNEYYLEQVERLTPEDLLPGTLELLNELHAADLKWAVASGSRNAYAVLDRLGILGSTFAVSDGSAAKRPKPAPDLFLDAARRLDTARQHCAVFEDAAAGVEAALAADMWCVGLGPRDRVGKAHVVYPSLQNVSLITILTALQKKG